MSKEIESPEFENIYGSLDSFEDINPMLDRRYEAFMESRDGFPIFYEHGGEVRPVKTKIDNLPDELKPIGQGGLVFDSESAQKNKGERELLTQLQDVLSKQENASLLGNSYKDLNEDQKKTAGIPKFVSKAFDQVKTIKDKDFANLSTGELLSKLIDGLEWKLENIGNEKGMGGKYVANLLAVDANGASFSRSARFNSEEKITAVADASLAHEIEKFNKFQSELKTGPITKEQAQQLNLELKSQGVHLHVDMKQFTPEQSSLTPKFVMDVNFISAMDSAKSGEDKFWSALDSAHDALRGKAATITKEVGGVEFALGNSLLTEASQSSYGGGKMASILGNGVKADKRLSQLDQRLELLNAQKDILGEGCYTEGFEAFLANPDQVMFYESKGMMTGLKGAEKAFVDYYKACSIDRSYKGEFDEMFPAPTNVFTSEMGDVAFAELTGVHDHVSCKSGQDRTLSLVALRSAVAKCGWPSDPTPELTGEYKDNFTREFVATVAREAKSVVEHARGEGGKLKYNLDEVLNKQPVPGAIFDYLESGQAEHLRSEIVLDTALREGLKSVKLPKGKLNSDFGLGSNIGDKDLGKIVDNVCSLFPENKGQDVKSLMTASYSKKQSGGKQALLENFEKLSNLKQEFDNLKASVEFVQADQNAQDDLCADFKLKIAEVSEGLRSEKETSQGKVSLLKTFVGLKGQSKTSELRDLFSKSMASLLQEVSSVSQDAVAVDAAGIYSQKLDAQLVKDLKALEKSGDLDFSSVSVEGRGDNKENARPAPPNQNNLQNKDTRNDRSL